MKSALAQCRLFNLAIALVLFLSIAKAVRLLRFSAHAQIALASFRAGRGRLLGLAPLPRFHQSGVPGCRLALVVLLIFVAYSSAFCVLLHGGLRHFMSFSRALQVPEPSPRPALAEQQGHRRAWG